MITEAQSIVKENTQVADTIDTWWINQLVS